MVLPMVAASVGVLHAAADNHNDYDHYDHNDTADDDYDNHTNHNDYDHYDHNDTADDDYDNHTNHDDTHDDHIAAAAVIFCDGTIRSMLKNRGLRRTDQLAALG